MPDSFTVDQDQPLVKSVGRVGQRAIDHPSLVSHIAHPRIKVLLTMWAALFVTSLWAMMAGPVLRLCSYECLGICTYESRQITHYIHYI